MSQNWQEERYEELTDQQIKDLAQLALTVSVNQSVWDIDKFSWAVIGINDDRVDMSQLGDISRYSAKQLIWLICCMQYGCDISPINDPEKFSHEKMQKYFLNTACANERKRRREEEDLQRQDSQTPE